MDAGLGRNKRAQAPAHANLLPEPAELYLEQDFFSPLESAGFLDALLQEISWKQEPVVIFGRRVLQPRLTAWYGEEGLEYRYSGISLKALAWTPALREVKKRVEGRTGQSFNGVLLNQYRDGRDSMGWHRDNEKSLGVNPVIASVSFGAPRDFLVRRYGTHADRHTFELRSGSLLLMAGATQRLWEHALPKRERETGVRVNLTFRRLVR